MTPQDMIDFIIARGRWRGGVPLVQNGMLAIAIHPLAGWTVNQVAQWQTKPIAYRGRIQIWPSHRFFTPFAVWRGQDNWNYRYLETAMNAADRLWPQSDK